MTKIINLLGGPGSGKSTSAALIFGKMKEQGISVEHVQEYVKSWAWEGRKIEEFDQLYIFAKQARREYTIMNKVDFIVTDSPAFLSEFYEQKYYSNHIVRNAMSDYMNSISLAGGEYCNFMLRRNKPYNPHGRYETEEESRVIDQEMRNWMDKRGYSYTEVDSYKEILEIIGETL